MLTRCPNDEELSALNAFRKMLWSAPSSADFVTERGFLKRFPCPLCDTPMRFKGHGESVYCPSQQCLAKDFNFYFGQELNLNLTKCVSNCCSQHDLLVVDKAIKCQKPFPSSQQRYLCGECATLPYLTCTVCRKGPIEPRLIDSCTRCQLPVCSRCVAKSLTQSGGRQQQQQQQHSSRRCCAGCFQAHPPPNPPEEDEEGHHVHVHNNNTTTTTNDVYAVIIPTNSYDDAYYPPVAAHFGALGQADTMMSAWGG